MNKRVVTKTRYSVDTLTLSLALVSAFISTSFLDPINWPKQIALLTVMPFLFLKVFRLLRSIPLRGQFAVQTCIFLSAIILVTISSILSAISRDVSLTRTLWGIWGRNNGLLTLVALFLISFSFGIFALRRDFILKSIHALEIGSLLYCSYGIMQFFNIDPINWSQTGQVFSFFGNTNFASAMFALSASVFLVLLLFENSSFTLLAFRFCAFLLASSLTYATNSIQGLSALLVVILLSAFVKLDFSRNWKRFGYLVISSCFGFVIFLGTLGVGPLGDQIGQYTVQLRYQYWLTGIRIGNSSPIWGVGVDSYGDYFRTFRSQSLAETTSIDLTTNNAHNVFVQFYATLGIIGFLALVIPVVLGAYLSIHILMNAKTEKIERGVVSIFLALWAMAFFSIDNIAIAVWNYVFLGLVWGISTRYKNCVIEKDHPRKADSDLDPRKYLASILAAVLFTVSWSSSISDRNLQYFLANPVNPQDTAGVAARNAAILESARRYSVLETELYYLASELNKTNSVSELYELLDYSLEKYPKDFNLLDISAGYREQRGKQVEAIPYRERQLQIEPRHPRIWLSYAYDLRAAGFPDQARDAFEKVKEFQIFLTDDIKQQLPVISKDFNTSSAGD